MRHAAAAGSDLPIDFEHLAEEVEELADRRRDALSEAALTRTIEHLLKLELSPAAAPRRQWLLSVAEHRVRAQTLTEDSGRLRQQLPGLLPRAWRNARKLAVKGMAIDGESRAGCRSICPTAWTESSTMTGCRGRLRQAPVGA